MIILEIFCLHVLCYNICVIFIVVITRPLEPQFRVSQRASGFAVRPCRPHEFRPHPRNEEVTGVGEGATDVREEDAGGEERPTSCMDYWIRASDSSDVLSLAFLYIIW